MGDRCYLSLTVRRSDVAAVEKEFGESNTSADLTGGVLLNFEEVAAGGQRELEALSVLKVPFVGQHMGGDAYPPCVFASVNGELLLVAERNDLPTATVHSDGAVDPDDLRLAREYWALYKQASAIIKGEA